MSKIVIRAQAKPSAPLLSKLRKLMPLSLEAFRTRLEGVGPLVEGIVFGNDHDEVALVLLGVVDALESEGVSYELYELAYDEDFASAPLDCCIVSLETLQNILERF